MTDLAWHVFLFALGGVGLVILPLWIGKLIRPTAPNAEKLAVYECGEPTIGSSYIQFDLRFYVVALLFIIFDVEVAFFFPWAAVYGGAAQLSDPRLALESPARAELSSRLLSRPVEPASANVVDVETAQTLLATALVDVLVFFGVLLVGFAYVWKRGDLDWVRSIVSQEKRSRPLTRAPDTQPQREPQPVG